MLNSRLPRRIALYTPAKSNRIRTSTTNQFHPSPTRPLATQTKQLAPILRDRSGNAKAQVAKTAQVAHSNRLTLDSQVLYNQHFRRTHASVGSKRLITLLLATDTHLQSANCLVISTLNTPTPPPHAPTSRTTAPATLSHPRSAAISRLGRARNSVCYTFTGPASHKVASIKYR